MNALKHPFWKHIRCPNCGARDEHLESNGDKVTEVTLVVVCLAPDASAEPDENGEKRCGCQFMPNAANFDDCHEQLHQIYEACVGYDNPPEHRYDWCDSQCHLCDEPAED